jgi:hypothetical protein
MFPNAGPLPAGIKVVAAATKPAAPNETLAEELRKELIRFNINGLSIDRIPLTPPDDKRLADYPDGAWPDVPGYVTKDPKAYQPAGEDGRRHDPKTDSAAYVFDAPLGRHLRSSTYQTLVLAKGATPDAFVTLDSYATVYCKGNFDGTLKARSYAVVIIDGDLNGRVASDSYFYLVVRGKVNGTVEMPSGALAYLMGGLHPTQSELTLGFGRAYLAGNTPRALANRFKGDPAGTFYLQSSEDLPKGKTTINGHTIHVGTTNP